jgi:hypothetical protein
LKWKADHLWYVEEDMVPPDGILDEMLALDAPVVTADYNLTTGRATQYAPGGSILFGGMGCLLVKSEVFDRMERPFFRCNMYTGEGGRLGLERKYGGQDVHIFMECRRLGIPIAQVKRNCKHLRLEEPGALKTNIGVHKIVEL